MAMHRDSVYMEVALILRSLSGDPKTQVGACIVDPNDNVIVSSGTNNHPDGCKFTWRKGDGLDDKLLYVVHAEVNAMAKANRDITGCTMYQTLSPCKECAKLIIQAKIGKVVYLNDKPKSEKYRIGLSMLANAGIECVKYE